MQKSSYPDKQTVLRVCEEGNPYSIAFSFSSSVAVTHLTGGELGLGAATTSCYSYPSQRYTAKSESRLKAAEENRMARMIQHIKQLPLYNSLYNHRRPSKESSA